MIDFNIFLILVFITVLKTFNKCIIIVTIFETFKIILIIFSNHKDKQEHFQ